MWRAVVDGIRFRCDYDIADVPRLMAPQPAMPCKSLVDADDPPKACRESLTRP